MNRDKHTIILYQKEELLTETDTYEKLRRVLDLKKLVWVQKQQLKGRWVFRGDWWRKTRTQKSDCEKGLRPREAVAWPGIPQTMEDPTTYSGEMAWQQSTRHDHYSAKKHKEFPSGADVSGDG